MERSYWLGRKLASTANAESATCSQARLVHLDLAGRYSMKADAACPDQARRPIARRERADAAYYQRLETGARWLASRADDDGERDQHLGMAYRYSRLRQEAADGRR
jgi:hypothetical protein